MFILPQPTEYQPEYGDIGAVYGEFSSYLRDFDTATLAARSLICLQTMGYDTWEVLCDLGVRCEAVKEASRNLCPITGNHYYALMPVYIHTDSLPAYPLATQRWSQMATDRDWILESISERLEGDSLARYNFAEGTVDFLTRVFMGSGYTSGCLPHDGSHQMVPVVMDIAGTSDQVIAVCWEWYNK